MTVDPAMGTGTYLHSIIRRVAVTSETNEGPGAVRGAVTELARRLIGFEVQLGPFAVAQLRTTDLLRGLGMRSGQAALSLYVTDTLDDPHASVTQLGSGLEMIAQSRRRANEVKRKAAITVVIGNPPYRERAEGLGGWVERGSRAHGKGAGAILDDFRSPGNGLREYVLKNLYVYFWRWATWKVFDAHRERPDEDAGIVCFISTSGYLRGPGFNGMREYLRRTCSEGWVIDLTPEGQTPDIPTRVFPGVRQPLAIGVFVRQTNKNQERPAVIHYTSIAGRRADKLAALAELRLDSEAWRDVRTAWSAPLTPSAQGSWDDHPALSDLFPWTAPGVKANRTWVYAPTVDVLEQRWRRLTGADGDQQLRLFKPTRDSSLAATKDALPGLAGHSTRQDAVVRDRGGMKEAIRVGYRSFDRQWIIADSRLIDQPRPHLWAARRQDQVFLNELHSSPIMSGPGIVLSSLIPDMHHFKGSQGGRVLPLLHPGGRPNIAPGLLDALATLVGGEIFAGSVSAADLLAYVAAVVAHPAYTSTFADELTTPGIRVPLTADPALWSEAVQLGAQVVWAHTYGEAAVDAAAGRPHGDVRYPLDDPRRVRQRTPMTGMPSTQTYDEANQVLSLGDASWGPVRREVFDYDVGGKNVLRSWFNYRKAVPGGKKTSELDEMHVAEWPAQWSRELAELLSLLTRLVELEPAQADLLDRILAGPLLTVATLADHGVHWPTSAKDRKPRYDPPPTNDVPEYGQLSF